MSDSVDSLERLRELLRPRYEVEREIGRGGMATVYEATELHPRRRVAIKVLDPDVIGPSHRMRFVKEIDVAANLSHPNIVPIFAAGEVEGVPYYVMPFIDGETLRSRMASDPPTIEEAINIGYEVAGALAYAHERGIVHRDIKPENILLSGDHAVVADFGVARAVSVAGSERLTMAGSPIGTPAYMSPEQAAASDEVDARTDIYSLACVICEMVYGIVPDRRNPLAILSKDTRPLGPHGDGGTGELRRIRPVLERCLAPDPSARLASAGELAAGLGRSSSHGGVAPVDTSNLKYAWATVLIIGAIVGAFLIGQSLGSESGVPPSQRVLVTTFRNETGDSAMGSVGRMAADWLTQGLAQTGLVEVVPVTSAMGVTSDEEIQRIAESTGAGILLRGSYYLIGDSLHMQARIQMRETGALRVMDPVIASVDRPLDAVEELRRRALGELATILSNRLTYWSESTTQPPTYEAYQDFLDGIEAFIDHQWATAASHFEGAARRDSTFASAFLWQALSEINTGDFAAADSIARRLERRRERLRPLDRHFLDYVAAQVRGDLQGSLEAIRSAAGMAPGSEAVYALAERAFAVRRPSEALAAIQSIPPDQGFMDGWFHYWGVMTASQHMLGRHADAVAASARALEQYPDALPVLFYRGRALIFAGRVGELAGLMNQIRTSQAYNGVTAGDVFRALAMSLQSTGNRQAADRMFDASLAWYRSPSSASIRDPGVRTAGRARTLLYSGQADSAYRLFESLSRDGVLESRAYRSWSVNLEINLDSEPADLVAGAGFLGIAAYGSGRNEQGALYAEDLRSSRGQPYAFGNARFWEALVRAEAGQPDAALSLLESAFNEGLQFGMFMFMLPPLDQLKNRSEWTRLTEPRG